jgi:drug/metabolite transporter (DMT)-like permease
MIGMLTFGTLNTIVGKYLDTEQAPQNSGIEGRCYYFTHPYLQTAVMFFGELTCFGLLFIKLYMDKRKAVAQNDALLLSPGAQVAQQVKMKTNINPLLVAIPASCDVCGSTTTFIALVLVPASTYQMMRGCIVVITAFMSIIFLGRKQYRHHWVGIVCIISGVAWVGAVSVGSSSGGSAGAQLFGIVLLLVGQLFAGAQFITEEKILGDYYLEPFKVVGLEGMWGLTYYLALLPIMQMVQCGNQVDPKTFGLLCNYGYLENSSFAFNQMGQNGWIIFLIFLTIISIAAFNSFGIATTKYASAAQRSTIDTSRTLTTWILSVLLGLETFIALEIPGFILLAFGTLLYNEIIVLKFWGFDQYTKTALKEREGKDMRAGVRQQDQEYVATSPGAVYDSKRNIRQLERKLAHQNGASDDLIGDDFQMNAV